MTSIASVADTAEEKFVPYYDLFMPSLKHIVENAVQKELRLLRGKTIECISLIGLAVGKEKVSDLYYVKFTICNVAMAALRVQRGFFLLINGFPDAYCLTSSYSLFVLFLLLYINKLLLSFVCC